MKMDVLGARARGASLVDADVEPVGMHRVGEHTDRALRGREDRRTLLRGEREHPDDVANRRNQEVTARVRKAVHQDESQGAAVDHEGLIANARFGGFAQPADFARS